MRFHVWSAVILVMVLSIGAFAPQTTKAVAVAPVVAELSGARGQVIEHEVVLVNTSDQEETYYLSTLKFDASDEIGTPSFIPYEEDHSGLPDWISFFESEVTVPANDMTTTTATIAIPNDVMSGGHYAAIVASGSQNNEAAGVSVVVQTASLILLTVEGETVEQAALLDFVGPSWVNRLPVDFALRVQNQGNVHLQPTGTITIKSILGAEAAQLTVNLEEGKILPMSTRQFATQWSRAEVEAAGFWEEIKNEWQNLGLGRYTAELELVYSETSDPITTTLSFWVIPWHLGLVAVIVAFLMILISRIKIKINKNV